MGEKVGKTEERCASIELLCLLGVRVDLLYSFFVKIF